MADGEDGAGRGATNAASLNPIDAEERKSGPERRSSTGEGVKLGTVWSPEASGERREVPPRSRWLPTSHGCTSTSSVVILSPGSFLRRHLMRHLAREERESGREKWPRRILANSPLCSAPWKGYLQG